VISGLKKEDLGKVIQGGDRVPTARLVILLHEEPVARLLEEAIGFGGSRIPHSCVKLVAQTGMRGIC